MCSVLVRAAAGVSPSAAWVLVSVLFWWCTQVAVAVASMLVWRCSEDAVWVLVKMLFAVVAACV